MFNNAYVWHNLEPPQRLFTAPVFSGYERKKEPLPRHRRDKEIARALHSSRAATHFGLGCTDRTCRGLTTDKCNHLLQRLQLLQCQIPSRYYQLQRTHFPSGAVKHQPCRPRQARRLPCIRPRNSEVAIRAHQVTFMGQMAAMPGAQAEWLAPARLLALHLFPTL